ncbi:hypothetical protein NP233_g7637 [Leucocoprinus birnbaumii]|uniref:Uncharacterized protein n=1 Tax=Leucocoprinus birnbaumii TaxID=56174 RepID=A0AAD5VNT3_9AGAR|nr:hypothetical protein NP233_g7637 [Leucocoprinus birnbaumii]
MSISLYTVDIIIWNLNFQYAILDPNDNTTIKFEPTCPSQAVKAGFAVSGNLRTNSNSWYIYRVGNNTIRVGTPPQVEDSYWTIGFAPNGPVHALTVPAPPGVDPCFYWTCDADGRLVLGPPQGGTFWHQIFEWKATFFYQDGLMETKGMHCMM